MRYRIALLHTEEGVSVTVPGLPGCCSQGDSEVDAIANIKIAIVEYLAVAETQLSGREMRDIEVSV